MKKDTTIGIDLAKNVFALVALNQAGKESWRKTVRRKQLLALLAKQEQCMVAMEACGSSHYWAREIRKLGHDVQLLPPQHVKGYLRGQKNDYNDASAIAEACQHGKIRPVPIKSPEQQSKQSFHVIRRSIANERVRLSNQLRGILAEYGISLPKGVATLRRELPFILEDAENDLPIELRTLLARQYERFRDIEEELAWYEQQIKLQVKQDEVCQRLNEVPGIGPVIASSLKSWMGDGRQFSRGRDASAALGLVPRQHSSGGKNVLLGITKRGDSHMRALVVHGARSILSRVEGKTDPLSKWAQKLKTNRGFNKAAVALANKLVRIAWVIIARGETYRQAV